MIRSFRSYAAPTILAVTLTWLAGLAILAAFADGDAGEGWKAPDRAARKKNTVPADEKSIAAGKVFYEKECLSCHGATGKGDGPAAHDLTKNPGNLANPKLWEQTDGALFWKITEGKKPMPTFEQKFSPEERWQIINYCRTLAPRPADAK